MIAPPFEEGQRRSKGGCLGFTRFLITASRSQSSQWLIQVIACVLILPIRLNARAQHCDYKIQSQQNKEAKWKLWLLSHLAIAASLVGQEVLTKNAQMRLTVLSDLWAVLHVLSVFVERTLAQQFYLYPGCQLKEGKLQQKLTETWSLLLHHLLSSKFSFEALSLFCRHSLFPLAKGGLSFCV